MSGSIKNERGNWDHHPSVLLVRSAELDAVDDDYRNFVFDESISQRNAIEAAIKATRRDRLRHS